MDSLESTRRAIQERLMMYRSMRLHQETQRGLSMDGGAAVTPTLQAVSLPTPHSRTRNDTEESIEDEDQGHEPDAADIENEGGALSDSEFIDADRILDISGEPIDGNLEHFYEDSYDSKFDLPRKKSLVFDEERFEDIFLKCLICREVFNDDDKLPKMLACHHTFCLDCLRQMFRVEGEFRQNLTSAFRSMPIAVKIQCPTCRDGFIISEAEILRLPNDHTILELLIFVKTTGKSDIQYCNKHQLQALNFFCEACIIPVCSDCTVLDHKEKDGHTVLNLEDALEKYTPVLKTTMDDLDKERDKLTDNKTSLKRAQENIETIQSGLADQITTTFGRLREALFEREQELLDMCARDIDKKRDRLADNIKKVNERDESLKQASDYLQKAMLEKDIKEMFSFNQGIKEKLATPFEVTNDIPDDFSVTFHFNSRQEASIKTQITNLGDVTFEHS